ncbi:MAG: hypothetical protein IT445_17570 [Phycisphaeraceae bacterium]|nr:hypothetical protein [Phycisphaeraceae bacterium]
MKEYKGYKLIRDGELVAEVEVMLRDDHAEWESTISLQDALKVDDVRKAMQDKDYPRVIKLARLYRLTPIERSDLPGSDVA